MKFSTDQIDCICDTLQQRKDMTTLGEETELSFFKDLYCQEEQFWSICDISNTVKQSAI